MDNNEELKRVYDIFTDCWRLYRKLYPPGKPKDDDYWQQAVKEMEQLENKHCHSVLCQDLLCAVAKDLEKKAKLTCPAAEKNV
mgnify:FL=1